MSDSDIFNDFVQSQESSLKEGSSNAGEEIAKDFANSQQADETTTEEKPTGETQEAIQSSNEESNKDETSFEPNSESAAQSTQQNTNDTEVDDSESEDYSGSYRTLREAFEDVNNNLVEDYGYDYSDIEYIQSIDLDEIDDYSLVVQGKLIEDPEMTDTEIEVFMERFEPLFLDDEKIEEMIENEEITESEIKRLGAEYDRLMRDSSKRILELKSKLPSIDDIEIAVGSANKAPSAEEQLKTLDSMMSNALSGYEKEVFRISDKDGNTLSEINFAVDDQAREQVKSTLVNPNGIFSRWTKEENGQVQIDHQKMLRDLVILTQSEKLMQIAYNDGAAKGGKGVVENISNISFDNKSGVAQTKDMNDIISATDKILSGE